MRKTKILATIGPASINEKVLNKFKDYEVNCLRINTAHGNFEQYTKAINSARKIQEFCFLLDIKGPEVRIRTKYPIEVTAGQVVPIGFNKKEDAYFSYDFYNEVAEGDKVFFDNGQIEAKIMLKKDQKIHLKFVEDSVIRINKGVNIPNKELKIPSLSKKDKQAIKYAIDNDLDYIALSFVRNKKDVLQLKKILKNSDIGIISKIENWEGVKNIDEIIQESEGIMIARGDLGVEIPEEKIPIIQKQIIDKCNEKGKIAIVATQMLESMVTNKLPTRAEVSDVANAILDGTDCVMLSGETAAGKHPINAVRVMNKVAREVENNVEKNIDLDVHGNMSEELSKSAFLLLQKSTANKLVTITRSGYSASLISRFRIGKPIIAVTDNKKSVRKMALVWGVKPILLDKIPKSSMVTRVGLHLLKRGEVKKEDFVIFFAGVKTMQEHVSNLIEIHYIKDLVEWKKKVLNGELKKLP